MKLILELETPKYLKIKHYAKIQKVLTSLGLKIKSFSTVENYKQKVLG